MERKRGYASFSLSPFTGRGWRVSRGYEPGEGLHHELRLTRSSLCSDHPLPAVRGEGKKSEVA
ncbi:hypothetical protein DFP91_2558 [Pseudorhodoplanes sinuspersici]|nr:hypothetical protein DFP91_2558 [Pseudorhodoplanes sinuspersici]